MVDKKEDKIVSNIIVYRPIVAYVFGLLSIIMAFLLPLAGFIFGAIGLFHTRNDNSDLTRKGMIYCIMGLVLSAIMVIVALFLIQNGFLGVNLDGM